MKTTKKVKGFTLIELIVVIAIRSNSRSINAWLCKKVKDFFS